MGNVAYMGILAVAVVASILATAGARRWAPRLGLIDQPSARKCHRTPVPLAGGLGIVVALAVSGIAVAAFGLSPALRTPATAALLAAGAFLFLVGLLDDRVDLRARYKLGLQILACAIAMAGGVVLREIPLGGGEAIGLGWMGYPATLFWLLGMVNAINLIDGMDGLAGGIVGLAAAALLAYAISHGLPVLGIPAALLLGSVLGFLPHNLSRRMVFLGDGGSMLLGFLLAAITVLAANHGGTSSPLVICLAFTAVPVFDVAITIYRRARSGTGVFCADAWHIHHRLLWLGLSPRRALLALLGVTVAVGCLGIAIATEFQVMPLSAGFVFGGAALVGVLRQERRRRATAPDPGKSGSDLVSLLLLARRPAPRVRPALVLTPPRPSAAATATASTTAPASNATDVGEVTLAARSHSRSSS